MRNALFVLLLATGALSARAGVEPGTMLDQATAPAAQDLLPPEIHAHYAKGDYTNPVVDFPDSAFQWDDGFAEASAWNRAHLVLDATKQPVDRETGRRPDYVSGHPFPDIREDDPDAGCKVLWNTIYTVYNGGNSRNVTSLEWVSPKGVERSAGQDVTCRPRTPRTSSSSSSRSR